jgi:hypothetical protein
MPGLPTDAGEGRSFFYPYRATEILDSLLRYPYILFIRRHLIAKEHPKVLDDVGLVPSSTAQNSYEKRI